MTRYRISYDPETKSFFLLDYYLQKVSRFCTFATLRNATEGWQR